MIVQLYCNSHILYCKWKQHREEKKLIVPRIVIQSSDGENNQIQPPEPPQRLNTSSNNKILAEVKHLLCLILFPLVDIVANMFRNSIDVTEIPTWVEMSRVWFYVNDFGGKCLVLFLYPLMFYFSHSELRKYYL